MSSNIQNRIENVTNILQQDTTRIQNLPDFVISQEDYDTIESQADDLLGGSPAPIVVTKPNIFVQSTEPTSKDGIWLQTNKTVEHYVSDYMLYESNGWDTNAMDTIESIPYPCWGNNCVAVGSDIYVFGSGTDGYRHYTYKYNTLTNTYTRLADIPSEFWGGNVVAVGNNIFLFGDYTDSYNRAYKYSISNNQYTLLTQTPIPIRGNSAVAVGKFVYLLGDRSYHNKVYRYDTVKDVYTNLEDIPYNFYNGTVTVIGTDAYLFGSGTAEYRQYAYKYDTVTDSYTRLTDLPYELNMGGSAAIGSDIYIFGSYVDDYKQYVYKYDTITGSYTRLTNIPYAFCNGGVCAIDVNVNEKAIYLVGGYFEQTKIGLLNINTKSYNNNSIVLLQNNPKYKAVLLSSEIQNGAKVSFEDVYHYTSSNKLDSTVPTYYGNGTSWIKFKN